MWAKFSESKWWGDFSEQCHHVDMLDVAFCVWVILRPQVDELREMVRPEDGPVPREVVEVVHNDGDKQIKHQKGADHKETDEERVSDIRTTTALFSCVIRVLVTYSPVLAVNI